VSVVCPGCGRAVEPPDRFCGACGANIGEPSHDEPTDAFDPVDAVPHSDDRERFPTECGLFVVESGPKAGSRYGLEAAVTSVGRHGEADICSMTSLFLEGMPLLSGLAIDTWRVMRGR